MFLVSKMYGRKQGKDTFEKFFNEIVDINFSKQNPLPDSQVIEILKTNVDDDVR